MTDAATNPGAATPRKSSLLTLDDRTRRRNASEARFKAYGITAIAVAIFFLIVLLFSILRSGLPAYTTTVADVEFTVTQAQFEEAESQLFKTKAYEQLFIAQLQDQLTESGMQVEFDAAAIERIMGKVGGNIREFYQANPDQLGQPVSFELSSSSRVDGYYKGRVTREGLQESRFLQLSDLDLVDALAEAGIIRQAFNWNFITGADSGVDNPGGAGIGASVVGSSN